MYRFGVQRSTLTLWSICQFIDVFVWAITVMASGMCASACLNESDTDQVTPRPQSIAIVTALNHVLSLSTRDIHHVQCSIGREGLQVHGSTS